MSGCGSHFQSPCHYAIEYWWPYIMPSEAVVFMMSFALRLTYSLSPPFISTFRDLWRLQIASRKQLTFKKGHSAIHAAEAMVRLKWLWHCWMTLNLILISQGIDLVWSVCLVLSAEELVIGIIIAYELWVMFRYNSSALFLVFHNDTQFARTLNWFSEPWLNLN